MVKNRSKRELKNERVSELKMMRVKWWRFRLMQMMMKTKSMDNDM